MSSTNRAKTESTGNAWSRIPKSVKTATSTCPKTTLHQPNQQGAAKVSDKLYVSSLSDETANNKDNSGWIEVPKKKRNRRRNRRATNYA